MKFDLIKVEEKDKNVIYNLMQLYTYELSVFEDETTTFTMLDSGLYVMNKYIERYWQNLKKLNFDINLDIKKVEDIKCMESYKSSISEEHGINLIKDEDRNILSIGISTAGSAEIKMARKNPNSHIIATTIDTKGLEFTKKIIMQEKLEDRIELRIENITEKLSYADNYFDFIYARLVLHYLNNMQLEKALSEIYRVMKKNGKFFVVVRSIEEWEAKLEGTTFEEETGFTKYPDIKTIGTDNVRYISRRLHSRNSIEQFLLKARFKINYIQEYEEYLYRDYERMDINSKPNKIIEVCASKI